ncbi:MAG: histidine phosphatase family protein [Clostridia bacterium]|nr:histidine phosphatase family protein [Clostridia bacterium]
MEKSKPIAELELYLVRHGQSMGNAGYDRDNLTIKEQNDPLLTEKGLMQADLVGKSLCNIDFDHIYTSGLIRAISTANGILTHQKTSKPVYILPILSEVGISPEYDGISIDEMKNYCKTAVLADGVSENDPRVYHSTFENEAEMFDRAKKVMEHMHSRYSSGEKVAIVAHAAFLTILIFTIMGFEEAPVFDISIQNTAVTKIVFYKPGTNPYGDISFEYINDTSHLK